MITKEVTEKINDSLIAIEKDKGIDILLAVESGSRAWGSERGVRRAP